MRRSDYQSRVSDYTPELAESTGSLGISP